MRACTVACISNISAMENPLSRHKQTAPCDSLLVFCTDTIMAKIHNSYKRSGRPHNAIQ